jgi:hypothetical protein
LPSVSGKRKLAALWPSGNILEGVIAMFVSSN